MSESRLHAKPYLVRSALATVEQARAAMLAAVAPLEAETVSLQQALGRTLAAAIHTARDQPPFSASQMDGYAVSAADTPGRLRVIGEAAAGRGFAGRCSPGMAVRISTGAAVPEGADAVVMQEDVKREDDVIEVPRLEKGQHIRPRGLDFSAGSMLLEKGRGLDGVKLALAAAAGTAALSVTRRPRVAILSGGDELAEPGIEPGPFQIFDSATHGIAALAASWGGVPRRLRLEKDDIEAIARAAEEGLGQSDLLVVIGGASVGDHDHARPALTRLGLELTVEKVAVRPGKPAWFGRSKLGPVLGLPGNPASALVCAHLFLRPLIQAMLGSDASVILRRAQLKEALPANGPREHYLRARLQAGETGELQVRAFEQQDSSLLSVFVAANALIRLLPDAPAAPAGALVDVLPLDSA